MFLNKQNDGSPLITLASTQEEIALAVGIAHEQAVKTNAAPNTVTVVVRELLLIAAEHGNKEPITAFIGHPSTIGTVHQKTSNPVQKQQEEVMQSRRAASKEACPGSLAMPQGRNEAARVQAVT